MADITLTRSSVGSVESNSLRPSSIARASSANNHLMSPSDIVGPSPVTSVGTEVTEIEDEASDDAKLESASEHSEPQPQVRPLPVLYIMVGDTDWF